MFDFEEKQEMFLVVICRAEVSQFMRGNISSKSLHKYLSDTTKTCLFLGAFSF